MEMMDVSSTVPSRKGKTRKEMGTVMGMGRKISSKVKFDGKLAFDKPRMQFRLTDARWS